MQLKPQWKIILNNSTFIKDVLGFVGDLELYGFDSTFHWIYTKRKMEDNIPHTCVLCKRNANSHQDIEEVQFRKKGTLFKDKITRYVCHNCIRKYIKNV